jgi:hypothetical protein
MEGSCRSVAEIAKVGTSIGIGFLRRRPDVARFLSHHVRFVERSTIDRFIESVNGRGTRYKGNVHRAIRAFEAGYVYRPGIAFDVTA